MDVILSGDAEKQFRRLPPKDRSKVLRKLQTLRDEPSAGKKLAGEFTGIRSLRVWPYRILYEINPFKHRIEVLKIAHRQGVYSG